VRSRAEYSALEATFLTCNAWPKAPHIVYLAISEAVAMNTLGASRTPTGMPEG
jgi:hypothetical protein